MIVSFTFVLAVAVALVGVWWFFNTNAPKVVIVPQILGKNVTDADQMLTRMKLQLRVAGKETSEKIPVDGILEVTPAPGQQVREGGTVAVKLSSGSRMVTVPELRGKTPDEARAVLTKLNLDLDRIDPTPDEKIPKGLIVRQMPNPKNKLDRFSRVNVWISSGSVDVGSGTGGQSPPSPNPNPVVTNPNTRYLYTVRIKLTKIEEPVTLRVDITDANGSRKIYEAERYPNDDVTVRTEGFGEEAVFRIYYNGELVSQVRKRADEDSGPPPSDNGDGQT